MNKSRQDTGELRRYYTKTEEGQKVSVNNSPRPRDDIRDKASYRSNSINNYYPTHPLNNSPSKTAPKLAITTMFGGNKFHSKESCYNFNMSITHLGSKSIGLSPVKSIPSVNQYNKKTIKTMHQQLKF